jgi:hypothetical protein
MFSCAPEQDKESRLIDRQQMGDAKGRRLPAPPEPWRTHKSGLIQPDIWRGGFELNLLANHLDFQADKLAILLLASGEFSLQFLNV